jgi:hypothetical protein
MTTTPGALILACIPGLYQLCGGVGPTKQRALCWYVDASTTSVRTALCTISRQRQLGSFRFGRARHTMLVRFGAFQVIG